MNINKAIRKQKKSSERFWLSMSFIFFVLPTLMIFAKVFSLFIIIYLISIEFLIIIAILASINKETLKFEYNNTLKIKNGIWKSKYSIKCSDVLFIHAYGEEENLKILIILKSKMRNKNLKVIDSEMLKKYTSSRGCNINAKVRNLQKKYYYVIINKGGYLKYELLNTIYKYCVNAYFTDNAIKKIKEYRT